MGFDVRVEAFILHNFTIENELRTLAQSQLGSQWEQSCSRGLIFSRRSNFKLQYLEGWLVIIIFLPNRHRYYVVFFVVQVTVDAVRQNSYSYTDFIYWSEYISLSLSGNNNWFILAQQNSDVARHGTCIKHSFDHGVTSSACGANTGILSPRTTLASYDQLSQSTMVHSLRTVCHWWQHDVGATLTQPPVPFYLHLGKRRTPPGS